MENMGQQCQMKQGLLICLDQAVMAGRGVISITRPAQPKAILLPLFQLSSCHLHNIMHFGCFYANFGGDNFSYNEHRASNRKLFMAQTPGSPEPSQVKQWLTGPWIAWRDPGGAARSQRAATRIPNTPHTVWTGPGSASTALMDSETDRT